MRGACMLALAGERLALLPQRLAALPEHGTLLAADAHVGKAVAYRALGVPVPRGSTAETLAALDAGLAASGARRLVFLGDFLHAARSRTRATFEMLAQWRARHRGIEMLLVRGNHDLRAGDPPPELGIAVTDEPLRLGALALCHHPRPVPGAYVLAGHWHPCVGVGGRAHQRLRLPCFWFGDPAMRPVGVLPAVGGFTGMHPIERRAGDRVFAVTPECVMELPGDADWPPRPAGTAPYTSSR